MLGEHAERGFAVGFRRKGVVSLYRGMRFLMEDWFSTKTPDPALAFAACFRSLITDTEQKDAPAWRCCGCFMNGVHRDAGGEAGIAAGWPGSGAAAGEQ